MKKQHVIRLTNEGLFIYTINDLLSPFLFSAKMNFMSLYNELGLKPMVRLKQRNKGVIKSKADILRYCTREEDPKCLNSKETLSNANHVEK